MDLAITASNTRGVTVAPEPTLARWEQHLQAHVGERVPRVYGRDFWMIRR